MSKVDEILTKLYEDAKEDGENSTEACDVYNIGVVSKAKSQLLSALLEDCPKDQIKKWSNKEPTRAYIEGINQANQLWKEHIKKVVG